MPDKHITFSESFLGLGSFVLATLIAPQTIDDLWEKYSNARKSGNYPSSHSFENLVLTVDVLFAVGAVAEPDQSGVLRRCV